MLVNVFTSPLGYDALQIHFEMDLIGKFAELQQEIRSIIELVTKANQDEYLNLAESARFLKVSVSTMEKISANRLIPVYKPSGGRVYFKKQDLIMHIESGRLRSRQEIEESVIGKTEV